MRSTIFIIILILAFFSLMGGGLWNIFKANEVVMGAIQLGFAAACLFGIVFLLVRK